MRVQHPVRRMADVAAARIVSPLTLSTALSTAFSVALSMLFGLTVGGSAMASDPADQPAFEFSRTRESVIRLDTSSGEAWFASTRGTGSWVAVGGAPDPAGKTNEAGRYAISNIGSRSNVTVVGPRAKQEVYLALMDHATGRVFLVKLAAGEQWQMIPEPK